MTSERHEKKPGHRRNTLFCKSGDAFVKPAMTPGAVGWLVHHLKLLALNVERYRRHGAQAGHAPPLCESRNQSHQSSSQSLLHQPAELASTCAASG